MNRESIIVDIERIATLESEVDNIKDDVGDIKNDMREVRKTNVGIEKSLSKLTVIAESNQMLEPRVSALEKNVWRIVGVGSALVFVIPLLMKLLL